jgi:hypothetical protein
MLLERLKYYDLPLCPVDFFYLCKILWQLNPIKLNFIKIQLVCLFLSVSNRDLYYIRPPNAANSPDSAEAQLDPSPNRHVRGTQAREHETQGPALWSLGHQII